MTYPDNYKYTKEHEWVLVENKQAKVGITEFAQSELGEIVFAELPEVGASLNPGDSACVVESTKAASDVYSPIAGKISTVNQQLNDEPNLINSDPHNQGWLFTLDEISTEEVEQLMSAEEYQQFIGG